MGKLWDTLAADMLAADMHTAYLDKGEPLATSLLAVRAPACTDHIGAEIRTSGNDSFKHRMRINDIEIHDFGRREIVFF